VRSARGPAIAGRALADPHAANRREAILGLDACAEDWSTVALRQTLAGLPLRSLHPLQQADPAGQVVYRGNAWSPPERATTGALAALALARRGDTSSLQAIRALHAAVGADEAQADERKTLSDAITLLEAPATKPAP
jgi:hypothetical protein